MPIIGWFCPSCCRPVPFDHFEGTACGGVHPDYAAAMLTDIREHEEKREGREEGLIGVSYGIGCPRSKAIASTIDIYVNPLEWNSMMTGKAWHSVMERGCNNPELAEVEVKGEIEGFKLTGFIDRIRMTETGRVIEDWKHTNDYARKGIASLTEPKPEHMVQLSIYAELHKQQFNLPVDNAIVWYHFSSGTPPMIPLRSSVWPIEKCLDFHPFGGDWSVRELYQQMAASIAGKDWRELPLVGESQLFGTKNHCDYCDVRMVCWEDSRGAPF